MPDNRPPLEFCQLRCVVAWVLAIVLWARPCLCTTLECDFTDTSCGWKWSGGLVLISMDNSTLLGGTAPSKDANGDVKGTFLYYSAKTMNSEVMLQVTSPRFEPTAKASCSLEFYTHMYNMDLAIFKIVIAAPNSTWETASFSGNSLISWKKHEQRIGRVTQPFKVILEFIDKSSAVPSHLAIDGVRVKDCYDKDVKSTECLPRKFQCSDLLCIDEHKVCDLTEDCVDGEDERQECDKIPENAFCTFENGTCGWTVSGTEGALWITQSGRSSTKRNSGPSFDHTFQNASGVYLLTKFPTGKTFGSKSIFTSPIFPPPPSYHLNPDSQNFNSCAVRFFYHKYGKNIGDLTLNSVELEKGSSKQTKVESLWRSYGDKGNFWWPSAVFLRNVTNRYYLQFIAAKSFSAGEIAIDDISLSPKCFGIGVHPNDSIDFTFSEENNPIATDVMKTEFDVIKYAFSTCGATGRQGPNETLCTLTYNNTSTKVQIESEPGMEGAQKWIVPTNGIYTVFVRGAGGGSGIENQKKSFGTSIRATFNWTAGETLHFVIGQKGVSACSTENTIFVRGERCEGRLQKRNIKLLDKMNKKRNDGGGGGGGGATYVYKVDGELKIPLIVAAGGGGISAREPIETTDVINPNGTGFNNSLPPGNGFSGSSSGGGGGWNGTTNQTSAGQSLLEGAVGGEVCKRAGVWGTQGGFGGGGGGCASGGGGGGYRGGDAVQVESPYINGRGGTSYLTSDALRPSLSPGSNDGDGYVTIIPAQKGCGCEYLCVILDLENKESYCICPAGFILSIGGFLCNERITDAEHKDEGWANPKHLIILLLGITVAVGVIVFVACLGLMRYRKNQERDLSHEPLNNPEVQLSRLRNTNGIMVTDNPNYEFGGSTCTVQDLREIPREHLTLVKALGQGAFGEVYQGYLTNPSTDNSEIPVAVKTLPELSASQAELDFKMEALIMSKFNHTNIVSFIGVCFEKLPRFIILELLPGGDLKSYLRECRPKPQKPSPLTVMDLLMLAMDVAKGCQYLEENHFIHRDIAARNCLLTTKEAGRVVKIADFGMARDIYRADYYRKGGKAMLPVKWMPPEAFLDGIFTSKTDVWSFGVLLWEVISLGYMPYPGRGNQEVMQLVTSGGRLEPPTNCPSPVYHIMMQCWHPLPDERPNFITIIERLGYCLQDPDVFNAPLPVFNRAPSMERDATVMRPADADNGGFLRVQRPDPGLLLSPGSEDYLIPMPQSTYSIATERSDLQSSPSMGSVDQLLELEERGSAGGDTPSSRPSTWETNFMTPDTPTDGPVGQWSDLNHIRSLDLKRSEHENSIQSLKKRPGGYTEIPTEDEEPHADVTMPKKGASSRSQKILARDQSLDGLPEAPHMTNANETCQLKTSSPMTNNHPHLSLDASALSRQVGDNMPRRYMNVDVNFNSGDGSSTGNIPSFEQNAANRNVGPYDGFAGINPVA